MGDILRMSLSRLIDDVIWRARLFINRKLVNYVAGTVAVNQECKSELVDHIYSAFTISLIYGL